jgi:hypothetical protein
VRVSGLNYVFWGGREGYQSLLNSDVKKELRNAAAFFRMAVHHKQVEIRQFVAPAWLALIVWVVCWRDTGDRGKFPVVD